MVARCDFNAGHDEDGVLDGVDDAPITYPQPVEVVVSLEFLAAGRAGFHCQARDQAVDPSLTLRVRIGVRVRIGAMR